VNASLKIEYISEFSVKPFTENRNFISYISVNHSPKIALTAVRFDYLGLMCNIEVTDDGELEWDECQVKKYGQLVTRFYGVTS